MKIKLESVYVSDLDKALAFYTKVLGFVKKKDMPIGDSRYLTVVSPDEPDGIELLLEPNGEHPATKAYKKALYEEGIPLAAFLVEDVVGEHARLQSLGVVFKTAPQQFGHETIAVLDDTCGNWIAIYQTYDSLE
jgi:catechol 2,3-dioxygenase-like lactoylglutathione lyase family enzyme